MNTGEHHLSLRRARAPAVSRWLRTAAARVRAQITSCGFCGGQSGTRTGFLLVLWLLLSIFISPTAPYSSSSIIRGWCNRQKCGRRNKWTQSHPIPKKLHLAITIHGAVFRSYA
jgi:hypothetical protein